MPAPLEQTKIGEVLEKGMTPRALRISIYQRYYDGSVYDSKPGWLDDTDKPLIERKPCVQFPGVRNAIEAFSSMCLGDKRFPSLTTLTSEDDSALDPEYGLSEDESKIFDAGLLKIRDQARLPAKAQQILEVAMSSGTAVPMAAVIKGKLTIKQLDPKVCWPEFDGDGATLLSIEERYLYKEEVWSKQEKKFQTRLFMYRRRIDATHDTVFQPYEVTNVEDVPACLLFPNEAPYKTGEKPNGKYAHGFNFCPVIWYRFLDTISEVSQIDGRPIHWGLLSLCDAVNFGLSQRFRAALYCGDPQPWETGVDGDENQVAAPTMRLARTSQLSGDLAGYASSGKLGGQSGGTARAKGSNSMWSYVNPDSKVGLLALTGDSLKPLSDDVVDNRNTLRESLGHVELDIAALSKTEISGAAIAEMKAPMVAVANKIREDFGANCLLPLVNMLLRVAYASSAKGGLYLTGIKKLRPILEKCYRDVIDEVDTASANDTVLPASSSAKSKNKYWVDPTIKLAWGAYSETSETEQQTRVTATTMARDKGLITTNTAVRKLKDLYTDIHNVDQYVVTLEKEVADRQATADASMHGAIGALNGGTGDGGQPGTPGSTAGGPEAAGADSSADGGTGGTAASPGATGSSPAQAAGGTPSAARAARGTQAASPPKPIHDRSVSTTGVTESVYKQLLEDFPTSAIGWARTAHWQGPIDVPLDSIDFSNESEWAASDDPEKVALFVEKIKAGEKKPIILVNEPNGNKLIVADGHHRLLAYKQLGIPAYAYVAEVGAVKGDWDTMHDSGRKQKKAA